VTVRILQGDCRDVLATMPAESVHCVVTSPPYWGLRDYGVAGAIGLEESFEDWLDEIVGVFREIRRILRSDGVAWVQMGDSYVSGQGGRQSAVGELPPTLRRDRPAPKKRDDVDVMGWGERAVAPRNYPGRESGLKPKDLYGQPWRVAFALRDDGWWLRRDIVWHKPNAMPESVDDRPVTAHEYIFLLTKSARYWYDAEAIKEPASENTHPRRSVKMPDGWDTGPGGHGSYHRQGREKGKTRKVASGRDSLIRNNISFETVTFGDVLPDRHKRSVWTIPTAPFKESHFATFPPALIEPCIKAGTSEKGCCAKCGAPWGRETRQVGGKSGKSWHNHEGDLERGQRGGASAYHGEDRREYESYNRETVGWSPSCQCNAAVVPCLVLDPFGGAGTTGLVADRLQRDAILIELNPAYADMARRRIIGDAPLFATVE
jgi:DNA modification methylase